MSLRWKAAAKRILRSGLPVPLVIRPVIHLLYRLGVFVVEVFLFLRKFLWAEPVLRSICENVGKGLRAERLPYIRGRGRLSIGDRVNLSGRSSFYFMGGMPERPEIRVGSDTFIGNGCTFSAARLILIGDHCLIAALVRIHDNDGHSLDPVKRRAGHPIGLADSAPVVLEENVWIGAGATILKGVRIGRDSVVGSGAVVTSDVPQGTVVAGNPAMPVKRLKT